MAEKDTNRPGSEYDDNWRPGTSDGAQSGGRLPNFDGQGNSSTDVGTGGRIPNFDGRGNSSTTPGNKDDIRNMEESGASDNGQSGGRLPNFDGQGNSSTDVGTGEGGTSDRVGRGYTAGDATNNRMRNASEKNLGGLKIKLGGGSSKTKRRIIFGAAGLFAGGALTIGGFFFGFMNIFKIDNFLSNVEKRAFMRWQVDMDGRSTKWIQAYLVLRLGEVEDPELQPRDRDNIVFRSNQVDSGNPAIEWFRTLRGTESNRTERAANFEADVFNDSGIKFASVAYKEDGMVKFRPAVVEIDGRRLTFTPTNAEIAAIERGDVNAFNGRLRDFVEVKVFENDKVARKEIKRVVNEKLKPWQVYKKRQLRKDIQNMTGVRDWRFFEKTRADWAEKRISVRNKIIVKALPENTKTGKFVKCIFGIETCRSSPDPSNPDNRSPASTGDGGLSEDRNSEGIHKQFTSKIVSRLSLFTGVLESLDSLSKVDKGMRDGSLSKMVVAARAAQAVGLFQVYSTARDQMKTGEVNSDEVGEFMKYANGMGNNEAWSSVLGTSTTLAYSGTAYAQEAENTKKEKYCSEEHQTLVNAGKTDKGEFAYSCEKIGGSTRAAEIEDGWVNGPIGQVLGPVLGAYRDSVGGIFGPIIDFVNGVIGSVVNPAVKLVLQAAGLQDNVDGLVQWASTNVVSYLGAGPLTDSGTPSNAEGNFVAQGGAQLAETTARSHGAGITNATTKADSDQRVLAYQQETENTQGFKQKYLALDNPDSAASKQLFAIANSPTLSSPGTFISSIFSSVGSIPGKIFGTTPASAATTVNPRALAEFSRIDTYDLPKQCINSNILTATPASVTNADDLGIIPASELTWELVGNDKDFYDRLYKDSPDDDKALEVYNCGLFDNGVRGSLGALYGYDKDNPIESSTPAPAADDASDAGSDDSAGGGEASGDAKALAQQILDNNKIDLLNYCRYCQEDIQNTANGNPAYGDVRLDIKLLQFLVDLGQNMDVNVNSITGEGCGHSSDTCKSAGGSSEHYEGHAVDFECDMTDGASMDRIAAKYGIKTNYERCDAGINHWHYSTSGN